MHPRTRRALEDLPPEKRAFAEAAIARWATSEARAEEAEVIRKVREEFPPLRPVAETQAVLDALRDERQRQGLSLDELAQRSGIAPARLIGLEEGRIPRPDVETLQRYAEALGKHLRWELVEAGR